MKFEDRTLDLDEVSNLYQCQIATIKPYALMLAPVYVLMKRNEKLVCVKSPLDFFQTEELSNLSRYEVFYLPKSVKEVARFQTVAKIHRALMTSAVSDFPRSPFEISNDMIESVAVLWGESLRIEPYFASIYADELCGPLDSEQLLKGRELTVDKHEHGILLSGLSIFMLAHLGWYDLSLLKSIRQTIYTQVIAAQNWDKSSETWGLLVRDLSRMITEHGEVSVRRLSESGSEWSCKLLSRLKRVAENPITYKYPSLRINDLGGYFHEAA